METVTRSGLEAAIRAYGSLLIRWSSYGGKSWSKPSSTRELLKIPITRNKTLLSWPCSPRRVAEEEVQHFLVWAFEAGGPFASRGADSNPKHSPAILQSVLLPSALTQVVMLRSMRPYLKASPFAEEMAFERVHSVVCDVLEKNTLRS